MPNAESINPPHDDCSPQRRRFDQQVARILNSWLRREKTYLIGPNDYSLIADPTLIVRAVDGTPLYSDIHTIQLDEADGFVLTQPSAGVVRIDLSGVPSNLTVRESDSSPSISSVTDLAFNQVSGFIVSTTGTGNATVSFTIPSGTITGPMIDSDAFNVDWQVVTKVCPEKQWLSAAGTVEIGGIEYPLDIGLSLSASPSTGAVEVVTSVTTEKTTATMLSGTLIGTPHCVEEDTCCPPCDCVCEGYEVAGEGETQFTNVAATSHDGIAPGEFYFNWTLEYIACLPSGAVGYDISVTDIAPTVAGTCIDPSSFGSPQVTIAVDEFDGCTAGSAIDSDTQTGTCPIVYPTATATVPATSADCSKVRITLTINYYSDTDDAGAVVAFKLNVNPV